MSLEPGAIFFQRGFPILDLELIKTLFSETPICLLLITYQFFMFKEVTPFRKVSPLAKTFGEILSDG